MVVHQITIVTQLCNCAVHSVSDGGRASVPLGEVKLGPGSEDGVQVADAKRRLLPAG